MGNDNASAALKFAVGLVVTMILVGIIIVAFSFARSHANSAISSTSKDISQIEESRYTMYDGATITGAEVLNLIKKFENENVCVAVDTTLATSAVTTVDTSITNSGTPTAGTATTAYIQEGFGGKKHKQEDEASYVRLAKDTGSASYINPSSEYYGLVAYSSTSGAIQGLYFKRIH
jgi:hypothetical protein